MSDSTPESVKAWEDFCQRLKAAGNVLALPATPQDDLSQAEGLRKLARMIRMGLEGSLEYAHSDFPEVYQLVTPTTLGEGETSDSHYHQVMIDGSKSYRIFGKRGEAPFIEFTVYAGKIGYDEKSRQVGAITEVDLAVNADGSYELFLSPDEQKGNWIRTTPDASVVFIRQYAHDWSQTADASFEIEQLGVEGRRPPVNLAEVTQALENTAVYVSRSVHTWAAIAAGSAERGPTNAIAPLPQATADDSPEMPTGHRFASGYFRLAADEALVIEFTPEEVPYWGLDFTTFWFEPLSYADHRSHVNNRTAKYEADGSVRVVVGAEAGGAANWVDTLGHLEGVIMFRWSRTNAPLPTFETKVVKLAEL